MNPSNRKLHMNHVKKGKDPPTPGEGVRRLPAQGNHSFCSSNTSQPNSLLLYRQIK
ncbi:UNVERIFIED_CONTAM: hypothetical protein FKN15_041082 [Acipenser sinensis]